jgi:hypothetical protein
MTEEKGGRMAAVSELIPLFSYGLACLYSGEGLDRGLDLKQRYVARKQMRVTGSNGMFD